jgi:LysM repeat protein
MNHLRQVLFGSLAALLSVGIVLGSFSLALTEGVERVALLPSPVPTETEVPATNPTLALMTLPPTPVTIPSITHTVSIQNIETLTPTLTPTLTLMPSITHTTTPQTYCTAPGGWVTLLVQPGDTLKSLAEKYNSTEQALMEGNCLIVDTLIPGTLLFVPSLPPTAPIALCGAPSGWIRYTVQSGDTLFQLSRELGVSVAQLQNANCLGSSTLIRAGQTLYVPFLPSRPVSPSPTPTQAPASPTSVPASPTVISETPTITLTSPPPSPTLPPPTATTLPTPSPAPTEPPPLPTETAEPTPAEATPGTGEPSGTQEP